MGEDKRVTQRAPGNPATGAGFFSGYEKYIKEMEMKSNQTNQSLIAIFGARRIGKTSCVKEFFERLEKCSEDEGPIGIYVDVEHMNTPFKVVEKIIDSIDKEARAERTVLSKFMGLKNTFQKEVAEWIPDGFKGKLADPTGQFGSIEGGLRIPRVTFEKCVTFLANELKTIGRPLFIAIDELPDAIIKIQKSHSEVNQAKEDIDLLLSSFRNLINEGKITNKLIYLGSSNIVKTLQELNLESKINNRADIQFYPMTYEEAYKLFNELCDVEEGRDLLRCFNKDSETEDFIRNYFTLCTPSDIQYFIDALLSIKMSPSAQESKLNILREAYTKVISNDKGPSYYENRLKEYYTPKELKTAKSILKEVAKSEFDAGKKLDKKTLITILKKEISHKEFEIEHIVRVQRFLQRDMLIHEDGEQKIQIYNKPFAFFLYELATGNYKWEHKIS